MEFSVNENSRKHLDLILKKGGKENKLFVLNFTLFETGFNLMDLLRK